MDCGHLGAMLISLRVRQGYWRADSISLVVFYCLNSHVCKGYTAILGGRIPHILIPGSMLGFVYNVGTYNLSRPPLSGGRCPYSCSLISGEMPYLTSWLMKTSRGMCCKTPDSIGVASSDMVLLKNSSSASEAGWEKNMLGTR